MLAICSPRRDLFNVALEGASQGSPLALAIIDLDRFKEVNDRLGHAVGDEVLQAMASKLQAAHYLGDHSIARLGGDEFVVILRGDRPHSLLTKNVASLLSDFRHTVHADRGTIMVSATIGVCCYSGAHVDRSSLLKEADEALYRAKRMQRGTGAIAGHSRLIHRTFNPTGTCAA